MLPWLKDPNAKISFWAIIKDNLGKDISKLSVPVFFNDPTSLLQKCAQSMEYNELLDRAGTEPNPAKRIALIAIHGISQVTICERTVSKPFNPLLGETYEYVCNDFSYLAEQVSHHPPITANYCRSNKGLYSLFTNQKTNTKFTGKMLALTQQYRTYIDLDKFEERYEMIFPVMSAHNLVIGSMYIDVGETMTVRKVGQIESEIATINFTRRGWFSKEAFKCDGEVSVFDINTGSRKVVYNIYGNWNNEIYLIAVSGGKPVGEAELIWRKKPYPELWDHMYGMSHFSLQLNYFPKRLHNKVAPTDTRRR